MIRGIIIRHATNKRTIRTPHGSGFITERHQLKRTFRKITYQHSHSTSTRHPRRKRRPRLRSGVMANKGRKGRGDKSTNQNKTTAPATANLGETPSPPQNKGAASSTQPKNPALPEAPGGAVSGRRGRRPSAALLSACRPTSLPHPHTSRQGLTFGGFFSC